MGPNVEDGIAGLDPAERRKVEEMAVEFIAEEMTLRELRRARRLTQVSVARELGVSQDAVSRMRSCLICEYRNPCRCRYPPVAGDAIVPNRSIKFSPLRSDLSSIRRTGGICL